MMNKIEEYLNKLDKKNTILLYVSVVIAVFVVYYNFNYGVLSKTIEENRDIIAELERKMQNTNELKSKLTALKRSLKSLKEKNTVYSEDLKYLNILIKTSDVLNIKEEKFIDILKNVLQKASENKILASYVIKKDVNGYVVYEIDISGEFPEDKFMKFYKFIRDLEKIHAIKSVRTLYVSKKKDVSFKLECVFWSFR